MRTPRWPIVGIGVRETDPAERQLRPGDTFRSFASRFADVRETDPAERQLRHCFTHRTFFFFLMVRETDPAERQLRHGEPVSVLNCAFWLEKQTQPKGN